MPLINPGSKAPDFTLPDQNGAHRSLSDFAGRSLILYFYPKDDTSGCTAEACAFRDGLPAFNSAKAAIVGVSPDSEASHAKFARKYNLNFTLLADVPGPDGTPGVCDDYGVWHEKSMYGKTYMGVVRTTYLIDAKGVVRRRWDKVSVTGHADEVLAELGGAGAKSAAIVEPKPRKTKAKSGAKPAPAKKKAARTAKPGGKKKAGTTGKKTKAR
jgi:thioredoxin-dependent peroxiredoxin